MREDYSILQIIANNSIVIYGTGYIATKLSELMALLGVQSRCYVVSNGHLENNLFCYKPVVEIKNYKQRENEIVLVAVGELYKAEIAENLEELQIEYYCVSEDDLKFLVRRINKISTDDFLTSVKPVSDMFGVDRGQPIDRYYIESFLKAECQNQNPELTLEVGDDSYSNLYFGQAEHEILDFSKGMDLTKTGSIKREAYDVFICTQTLNFIYDIRAAIQGCYDLLKKDGILLATVAGNISQISRYDMDRWGDYWRFTELSITRLFKEVFGDKVETRLYGNCMAATAFIQGLAVEDIDSKLLNECDPDYSIVIGIVAVK
jgi:SAM-dependent methyltransferase